MAYHSVKYLLLQMRFMLAFMLTITAMPAGSADICDVNEDGSVSEADISLIFQARNTLATVPFDARDIDRDGLVTVKDGRQCVCLFNPCVSGPTPSNEPPITDPGSDQLATRQNAGFQAVTLDGGASQDPDGDALNFQWVIQSHPSGSQASLINANTAITSLTPDLAGRYVAALTTTDGFGKSNTQTVNIDALNSAPTADAGTDATLFRAENSLFDATTLDGSGSSDVDGNVLNYRWSFISVPEGSQAVLNNPNTVMPNFTPDLDGSYEVQLIVGDGLTESAADTVRITTGNTAPIANAGADQTIFRDEGGLFKAVALEGAQSTDVDGNALNYNWSFVSVPEGSQAVLNNPNTVMPNFTPDLDGSYEVQLIVGDGLAESAADTVLITTGNTRPIANAGVDQTIFRDDSGLFKAVALEGSQSTDVDGNALNYNWSFVSIPEGSQVVLNNPNTVMPSFTPDLEGNYVIQLIVGDGQLNSLPDTVIITTGNSRPRANAGSDNTVFRNETSVFDPVILEGGQSTDIDGDSLSYDWSIISRPAGSQVQLNNPTTVMPAFTPDVDGEYVIQLIVNDGTLDSEPDTVVVSTGNTRPIARAGVDRLISRNESGGFVPVILDGSGSTDIDGDQLSFRWSAISSPVDSQVSLSNPNSVQPFFTPDVALAGNYVWQLIVSDGRFDSTPDTVVISTGALPPPIANAGEDQSINRMDGVFASVTLDGSQSSRTGSGPLNFRWALIRQPDGSNAVLTGTTTQNPTLIADVTGTYIAQLIVNDGITDSTPDTVMLTAENTIPVANAGIDQSRVPLTTFVEEGGLPTRVTLDGSQSSDADNDQLSYQWSLIGQPNGSTAVLNNPNIVNPSFTLGVEGVYVAQLIVHDGNISSPPDTVTITTNRSPVANAGTDQTVQLLSFDSVGGVGDVILDGSASFDPDNDTLAYQWQLLSGPATFVSLTPDNDNAAQATATLFQSGTYVFQLLVDDGELTSVPDTVSILASVQPNASAGPDQTGVAVNNPVTLDGSFSFDEDSDTLSYQWSFTARPAGSTAVINNSDTVQPMFIPDIEGTYTVQLIVNDGIGDSDPDMVDITTNLRPVANAGPDQTVSTATLSIPLDGGSSFDPDNDTLSYRWIILSEPGNTDVILNDPLTARPNLGFSGASIPGSYTLELIVNDGNIDSAADTVTITIVNQPPIANAGPDQTVFTSTTTFFIPLDGSGSSDPDNDTLSYRWVILSQPDSADPFILNNPSTAQPTLSSSFSEVIAVGSYTFELIVNDGNSDSVADTVTITVVNQPPIANAGPDQTVFTSGTATLFIPLDGSGSSDPDNDTLNYRWVILSQPAADAVLNDPSTAQPNLSSSGPTIPGSYTLELIVNDGNSDSAADTVTITVVNQPIL